MSPVYRVRSNYSSSLSTMNKTAVVNFYRSNGTLWTQAAMPGFHSREPLPVVTTIKDEIHAVRKGQGATSGRYPPGFCSQVSLDFKNAVRYVDVPYVERGVTYTIRPIAGGEGAPIVLPNNVGLTNWIGDDNNPQPHYEWNLVARPPDSIVNLLSEEAWNYFSDVLPSHLSFGEFVQGITQLKDLLPEIGESVTKTVSGGYLNKKFGWDNLLHDLDTLSNLFSSVTERMEYFHRTYGVPTRLGFSRSVDYDPDPESVYPKNWETSIAHQVRVELVEYRCTFRATAWIIQTLDYVDGLIGFIRVLAGELGLNNPVKLFWQTLPLSFVVDWFFRISTHLDNLTRLDPPVGWDVYDATQSLEMNMTFKVSQLSRLGPLPYNTEMTSYLVPAKYYERLPNLTFQWELLNPSELTATQLTLLLAMLHQHT